MDLHSQGGYIAILDMNEANGQALTKGLGGNSRARFFTVDVSDTDSVEKCVEGVLAWSKETGKQIGGVVAAAGVGNPGKIIDRSGDPLNLEGFDFVISINLRGTIDLVRQLLPTITKNEPSEDSERGVLILVSSVAAYDGTDSLSVSTLKPVLLTTASRTTWPGGLLCVERRHCQSHASNGP